MLSLTTQAVSSQARIRGFVEQTDKDSIRRFLLASFHSSNEKRSGANIPSLHDLESGKLVGAVLPMSEQAQIQMRNSIEVIDYLLNQERVVWS